MAASARIEKLPALCLVAFYLSIVLLLLFTGGLETWGAVLVFTFLISVALLAVRIPRVIIEQFRYQRRWQRAASGHCVECNYDLRASAGRCSECGLPIESMAFQDIPAAADPLAVALAAAAIVSLLLALSIPVYGSGPENKTKATRAALSNIKSQLAAFDSELGRYPTTAEGLEALVSDPGTLPAWNHPLMDKLPQDAWGQLFVYRCPGAAGAAYDLRSLGPDGKEGTADDIPLDPY